MPSTDEFLALVEHGIKSQGGKLLTKFMLKLSVNVYVRSTIFGDNCVERCGRNQEFDQYTEVCRCTHKYAKLRDQCKKGSVERSPVSQN